MRLTTDLVSLRAQRIRWFGAFTGGRGGGSEVKGGIGIYRGKLSSSS